MAARLCAVGGGQLRAYVRTLLGGAAGICTCSVEEGAAPWGTMMSASSPPR